MANESKQSSGGIVSLASKLIRGLLMLPILALLQLTGTNDNKNSWGCLAFQHHRVPGFARVATFARHQRLQHDALFMASDGDDDELAKLKAEVEAKRASAESEAKRLQAEAEKAAKLKAEQDQQLQQAEEQLAKLQAEAEARKVAEKAKEAEKAAAPRRPNLEAEAELEATPNDKTKSKSKGFGKKKRKSKKKKSKQKPKDDDVETLLKAKEEAARVMAEIDAKLQAQTATSESGEKTKEEVAQPDVGDVLEDDATLMKMMEEMKKVQLELDARIKEEAAAKAKQEEEAKATEEAEAKKKEEAAKKKAAEVAEAKKKEEAEAAKEAEMKKEQEAAAKTKAKEEEEAKAAKAKEEAEATKNAEAASKTKEKVSKEVTAEPVNKTPTPSYSSSKGDVIETTATSNDADIETKKQSKPRKDTVKAKKDKEDDDESDMQKIDDPRRKGRSKKENLFDVIGRTASASVSMDEISKRKMQAKDKPQTPPPPTPDLLRKLKKKGPPESFGKSVVESYRTGATLQEQKGEQRVMPDLKKKGPPASFGSFAKAAGKMGIDDKTTIDTTDTDKGPPPSFGASVARASGGDVPEDLLKRGTASTDVDAPPPPPPSKSEKRNAENTIIDVQVDVEYTKKDTPPKKTSPKGSAPPLEVEKTIPTAPPLQVEKTVSEEKKNDPEPTKNIGKAAVDKASGKEESPTTEKTTEEKREKSTEDRVADLLKEAFSLSKEDSRVADLLQGVVAITTGTDDKKKGKKKKEGKGSAGRKRSRRVAAKEEVEEDDEFDDEFDEDIEDEYDDYDDEEEEEEEEEEEPTIMGTRSKQRKDTIKPDSNDFKRDPSRKPRPPGQFGNADNDGYFVDDDNDFFEYGANDRWQGRGPGQQRREPPMGSSGGYSVRPPSQSRDGQPPFQDDDDYYFLQFGKPPPRSGSSRYDEPRGPSRGSSRYDEPPGYYEGQDGYYDDDYDGPQVRPASAYEEEKPKGPPASFGFFVAGVSMDKTGYAPSTMKGDGFNGSGINGGSSVGGGGGGGATNFGSPGEEYGEEMSAPTGSMFGAGGVNGNRVSPPPQNQSPQDPFVVSEDQSGGGRKKGPPSNFGKSVAAAGEHQTGYSERSIEEEIANGGLSKNTGGMATPRRKTPAGGGSGNPAASSGGGGTPQEPGKKKPLFVVSEDEGAAPDFGSSVAEASGSKTGWAPKTTKRTGGGLEGGTMGGMRPKLKKPDAATAPPKKPQQFVDKAFDDAPPLEGKTSKQKTVKSPVRKQSVEGTEPTMQRNPAVNLVDGGASKNPPRQVQFGGSMMAPRIRRQAPPEQPAAQPESEEDDLEDKKEDE